MGTRESLKRIMRTLSTITSVAVLTTVGGVAVAATVSESSAKVERSVTTLPRCEYEDGSTQDACLWTGGRNGLGDSLVQLDRGRRTVVLPPEARALLQLPGYTYRLKDGSKVTVPSGKAQVAELVADGAPMRRASRALIAEYLHRTK